MIPARVHRLLSVLRTLLLMQPLHGDDQRSLRRRPHRRSQRRPVAATAGEERPGRKGRGGKAGEEGSGRKGREISVDAAACEGVRPQYEIAVPDSSAR